MGRKPLYDARGGRYRRKTLQGYIDQYAAAVTHPCCTPRRAGRIEEIFRRLSGAARTVLDIRPSEALSACDSRLGWYVQVSRVRDVALATLKCEEADRKHLADLRRKAAEGRLAAFAKKNKANIINA